MALSAIRASASVATWLYAGIIAIALIKLGSVSNFWLVAKIAFPWFLKIFGVLVTGFSIYFSVLLLVLRYRLKGTDYTVWQFLALPLPERLAIVNAARIKNA